MFFLKLFSKNQNWTFLKMSKIKNLKKVWKKTRKNDSEHNGLSHFLRNSNLLA